MATGTETETETPATFVWTRDVPAEVLYDPPVIAALVERALVAARADGRTVLGPAVTGVAELTEADIAVMARVDTEPGSEWHGMPEEVIEAEVAARVAAARGLRRFRVEFPVAADTEQPVLRQLDGRAAGAVFEQALENVRATAGSKEMCGTRMLRHDFGHLGPLLRAGEVDAAECRRCERTLTRDELLEQAARERGEA